MRYLKLLSVFGDSLLCGLDQLTVPSHLPPVLGPLLLNTTYNRANQFGLVWLIFSPIVRSNVGGEKQGKTEPITIILYFLHLFEFGVLDRERVVLSLQVLHFFPLGCNLKGISINA